MPYYFNIPFPNHSGLVELQEYLRTKLPQGTELVDPSRFHMTLVYVMEGEGIEEVPVPETLPVFGLGGSFMETFPPTQTGEARYAVTVGIEKTAALIYLQSALFYAVRATGAVVSTFSWPGLWRPHVTVAYTQDDPDRVDQYFMPPNTIHLQVDKFDLTTDGYEVVKSYGLQTVRADGTPIAEMTMLRDTLMTWEMKGSYPDVPIYPDVNIAALTEGDPKPKFLTLPIAKDDVTSENKRHYSKAIIDELVQQIRKKRPTGIQGHIPDKDRASLFPNPVIYWIGDTKVGDITWGKGYLPPSDTKDMVLRIAAVNGELGTSLYGPAEVEWDRQRGVWNVLPGSLVLEHIDLAPPDRMGIPALAAVPKVTAEMVGKNGKTDAKNGVPTTNETTQEGRDMPTEEKTTPAEVVVDRTKIIREMTVEDAAILPRMVQEAVLEKAPEKKLIAEIRGALSVDENANLVEVVKVLVQEIAQLRADGIVAEIGEQVKATVLPKAPETDKVKAMRQTVVEMVTLRKPENKAAVAGIVAEVIGKDHIKMQIEGTIVGEMGPNQKRPGATVGSADGATGMMKQKPVVADAK